MDDEEPIACVCVRLTACVQMKALDSHLNAQQPLTTMPSRKTREKHPPVIPFHLAIEYPPPPHSPRICVLAPPTSSHSQHRDDDAHIGSYERIKDRSHSLGVRTRPASSLAWSSSIAQRLAGHDELAVHSSHSTDRPLESVPLRMYIVKSVLVVRLATF